MSTDCKNCKANPAKEPKTILWRINEKSIIGEWICQECMGCVETWEGKPHYVHSKDCPSYCDYACNRDKGFDLAEQIKKYLWKD
jgi:hypothetical protein